MGPIKFFRWLLLLISLLSRVSIIISQERRKLRRLAEHNDRRLHVVIARYKEDMNHLEWLSSYSHTVYNRGETIPNPPFNSVDCLENIGRESFLYLKHIVTHYHHLADVTVFSQAVQSNPIYDNSDFKDSVEGLMNQRYWFSPENDGFVFLIPVCGTSKHPHDIKALGEIYGTEVQVLNDGYKLVLDFDVPNPRYSGTGCIAVTREAILRNSRDFYIGLARNMTSSNPMFGHFLERAWPAVFRSTCSLGRRFHCLLNSSITC